MILQARGGLPKLPLLHASDVLCVVLFCEELRQTNLSVEVIALFMLAAHHIRDPPLLRALGDTAKKKKPLINTLAVTFLVELLAKEPFSLQKDGLP